MFKLFLMLGLTVCIYSFANSQVECYETERTITTDWEQFDPNSAGAYPNDWDWTGADNDFRYDVYINGQLKSINTPFYPPDMIYDPQQGIVSSDGYSLGNVDNFGSAFEKNADFNDIDYQRSDGWELLYKSFGG